MGVFVFVSYSGKDAQLFRISEIAKSLTAYKEIDDVLYYEGDMPDNFIKYMSDNLDKCDVMLLFCSPNALQSPYVEKEWTAAEASHKPIIPVFKKIEHVPMLLRSRAGIEFDPSNLQINIKNLRDLILMRTRKHDLPVSEVQPSVKRDSPPITLPKDFPRQVIKTLRKYVAVRKIQEISLAKLAQRLRVDVDVLESALEDLIVDHVIRASIRADVLVLDSEWDLEKIVSYQGTSLIQREVNILIELERQVGQIPQVTEIEYDTFGLIIKVNHVTGLGLYNKKLKSLSESFGKLTQLVELNLRNNQLKFLPETFGNLTRLEWLSLRSNELNSLPESFFQLTNLQTLNLGGNQFTTLPETFGNLTNLKELYLHDNQLKFLPETFHQLSNLRVLDLGLNQLKFLPESFGQLTNLKQLRLGNNQLKTLPESFGNLVDLKELYLYENQLSSLPESFGNLRNLQRVYLGGNPLPQGERKKMARLVPRDCAISWD